MNYKNKKKLFNVALIFALIFSLITPFQNVSKAVETITVAEAIANNSGAATVEGYIVGTVNTGSGASITYKHTGPFTTDSNLALADDPNEKDKSKILTVQIPSGSIRTAINLKTNEGNLGKKVQLTGNLEAYFTVPGLKSLTAYTFVEQTNPVETKVAEVTATPSAGAVQANTAVALDTATADAKIYYTTDGTTVPTASSTEYTGPITIDTAKTIKAIAIKTGLENSDVATFSYTILSKKTIAEVRGSTPNSNVMLSGIVTGIFTSGGQNNVFVQDGTAGVIVRGLGLETKVNIGDEIQAFGVLKDYFGMAQVEATLANVTVLTANKGVPAAQIITSSQLTNENGESFEAELVTIVDVTIGAKNSNGNIAATDANGNLVLKPVNSELLTTGKTYDSITGVIDYNFNEFKIIPRDEFDIVEDASKTLAVEAIPGSGFIKAGDTVKLATRTVGATIYYTLDGSDPTTTSPVYSQPIQINAATTIKAMAKGTGLSNSDITTFEYIIQDGVIRIRDIQGKRHSSILNGKTVSDVEGVVTYIDGPNRFFIQDLVADDDDSTSEGILVFKSTHGMAVGQVVKVSGKVSEYYGEGYAEKTSTDLTITQIEATTITPNGTADLPTPIVLGDDRVAPTTIIDNDSFATFDPEQDAIDFWESIEGMYVQVDDAKVVALQKDGLVWVVPGTYPTNVKPGGLRITADDYNPDRIGVDVRNGATANKNYRAKMGDYYTGAIKGVVNYGYSNYKVMAQEPTLPPLTELDTNTLRVPTSIVPAVDKLTIATYNVENFSANTPDAKVTKIADAIVNKMKSPDIIGLNEVQDSNGETDNGNVDGTASAQLIIDKVKSLLGPTYAYTEVAPVNNSDGGAPGGNIRVGFLYNTDRVSLTAGAEKGTATQAVGYENGKLTLNPGRIDPTNETFRSSRKPLAAQFDFQGESIIVVANHFNSKGGDQPLFGKNQPPVLSSEVQRHKIAGIVNNFVKQVKAKNANANVVLLGDFNDFEFTQTLTIAKGNELKNMIDSVPLDERYNYSYQGNAQVLDHVLVTNNMFSNTTVDIVNINSGFMEEHGRASDHDPVIIQTKLTSAPVEVVPAVPAPANTKVYNLKGFKTKKIMVANQAANITVDVNSEIREGITLKGSYVKLQGEGLKNTVIIIAPNHAGAYIDLSGVEVEEVIIENANISQIRGAENVQTWTVKDGVDTSNIKFTTVGGEVFTSPFFSPPPTLPVNPTPVPPVDNGTVSGYYANAANKTGAALKLALHNIVKVQTKLSYAQVTEALKITDEDPNNSNNVILLYTNRSQAKTTFGPNVNDWNREHVWAKSHGDFGTTAGPGTDIHHLRPTDASVNSSRGHLDFDNGGTAHIECTECKFDNDSWEPPNRVKGDIARMLMYMAVRYEGNGEIDLELADKVNTYPTPTHGKKSVLLEWHKQDPVDAFEMNRNNKIQAIQGNRNPFIDHPEWADLIWPAS
jgi:uncharacterized protein